MRGRNFTRTTEVDNLSFYPLPTALSHSCANIVYTISLLCLQSGKPYFLDVPRIPNRDTADVIGYVDDSFIGNAKLSRYEYI